MRKSSLLEGLHLGWLQVYVACGCAAVLELADEVAVAYLGLVQELRMWRVRLSAGSPFFVRQLRFYQFGRLQADSGLWDGFLLLTYDRLFRSYLVLAVLGLSEFRLSERAFLQVWGGLGWLASLHFLRGQFTSLGFLFTTIFLGLGVLWLCLCCLLVGCVAL